LADQQKNAASQSSGSVVEHGAQSNLSSQRYQRRGVYRRFDSTASSQSLASTGAAAAAAVIDPHQRRLRSDSSLMTASTDSHWTQQPF